jgi:hypothetical protein
MKALKLLEKMADTVLRYRPESKIKQPRKRTKKAKVEISDSSK